MQFERETNENYRNNSVIDLIPQSSNILLLVILFVTFISAKKMWKGTKYETTNSWAKQSITNSLHISVTFSMPTIGFGWCGRILVLPQTNRFTGHNGHRKTPEIQPRLGCQRIDSYYHIQNSSSDFDFPVCKVSNQEPSLRDFHSNIYHEEVLLSAFFSFCPIQNEEG